MKKHLKKLTALLLSAMLASSAFTTGTIVASTATETADEGVGASSGQAGDNVKWTLDGSILTISGSGDMWDYNFYMPVSGFDNVNVSPFSQYYRNDIKTIVIEYGVTSIGNHTFLGCCNLTSVRIPNSVTSIGINAFAACTSLTSVNIPNNMTNITAGAFEQCTSLTSVKIPSSVQSIGNFAFACCSSLESVTLYSSTDDVANNAFYNCPNVCFTYKDDNIILHNVRRGDVDGDGKVTINDATLVQRYLVGLIDLTDKLDTADMNGDGVANIIDVTLIQMIAAQSLSKE